VRVYYKPFVGWIWGGAILMALGGGLAVSDRRYALAACKEREARQAVKPEELPSTVAASVANPSSSV
jgi:cytochrome c-type biogenesis protein CcmF